METNDTVLAEYIAEGEEITQRVSQNLQLLEKNEASKETLDGIYRDVHTLKGSSNLFGFAQVGQLAHAMEASLEPIRKGIAPISSKLVDALFEGIDILESLLTAIQKDKKEPDFSGELKKMVPKLVELTLTAVQGNMNLSKDSVPASENQVAPSPNIIPSAPPIATQVVAPPQPTAVTPKPIEAETLQKEISKPLKVEMEKKMSSEVNHDNEGQGAAASGDKSQTIRVQVSLLDKLMNLVGEMVLVRNQVLQYSKNSEVFEDAEFGKLSKRLDIVTSELQGEVMQTRMQPVGAVLDKFQRVVRDLSRDLGKKIELALIGQETEVDKSLLEAVKDPLTHLIRNSCDHGVETPEDRKKAGKSETGTVTVKSYHEGGQVIIEISDDGKGLHRDKILAKAQEKGLIGAGQNPSGMSDKEVFDFIFKPGFSTAAAVTTVSGRGVGMDVVKTNIEKIGGTVELESVPGKGATVRLRIPLTLAIVPALLVRSGVNRFAIPQIKLVELVKASGTSKDQDQNRIEFLQGKPVFRMRGKLLPLVSVSDALKLTNESNVQSYINSDSVNIVILNVDGKHMGLIVDEIQDTFDIVVKPLSKFLKNLNVYSGATIMGDGSVSLILDIDGIARLSEVFQGNKADNTLDLASAKAKTGDLQEFLLFKTKAAGRYAMALCLVNRLEEFTRSQVEFVGEQPLVRYRDSILPLITINGFLGYSKGEEIVSKDISPNTKMSVIVVKKLGKNFGLVVDDILDVVTIRESIDDSLRDRPGIIGSVLFNQEVLVVLDPLEVIDIEYRKMNKQYHGSDVEIKKADEAIQTKFNGIKILYAEDAAFFRKQVCNNLRKVGIDIVTANDGKEAFELLEQKGPGHFNLILSDIEMPNMTGFDFARAVRKNQNYNSTPMIALTTRYTDVDKEEGRVAGFNLYLEKFNSDVVLKGISALLNLDKKAS